MPSGGNPDSFRPFCLTSGMRAPHRKQSLFVRPATPRRSGTVFRFTEKRTVPYSVYLYPTMHSLTLQERKWKHSVKIFGADACIFVNSVIN